jgi:hypothetical protein
LGLAAGWSASADHEGWFNGPNGEFKQEAPQDMAGIIALASGIKDMRALSSVNVLFNDIGTEKVQALVNILKEHPALKSLCGNKGNETELDMSGKPGKRMGAEGAIMLAPEIIDNGALSSLNLSSNWLTGYSGEEMSGNTQHRYLQQQ